MCSANAFQDSVRDPNVAENECELDEFYENHSSATAPETPTTPGTVPEVLRKNCYTPLPRQDYNALRNKLYDTQMLLLRLLKCHTENPSAKPIYLFLSGVGGAGKSVLLECCCQFLLHPEKSDVSSPQFRFRRYQARQHSLLAQAPLIRCSQSSLVNPRITTTSMNRWRPVSSKQ